MPHPLIRSAIDALAATVLAAAVWFALTSLLALHSLVASSIAGILFIRIFASLARLPAVRPLAQWSFVPASLEFEDEPGEIPLEQRAPDADTIQVTRMFGTNETPGEMQVRIERHLQAQQSPASDATEELREALAQLRRAAS